MPRAFLLPLLSVFILLPIAARAAPLPVVASFSILADLTRQIGGDEVTVTSLVDPDGDAHAFQPRPQDATAVAGAGLVIVNGLGFDSWMERLAQAAGYRGPVVVASAGVSSHTMEDEGQTVTDPHAWQDVGTMRRYAKTVAAALIKALPGAAAAITARADRYDAELAALDGDMRAQTAAVPAARRIIITSHDAFGYFGQAYGVRFLAPEGISTESQPTAAGIAALQRQIKAEGVHTLFFENMSNGRLLQQIAHDTGTTIGGTLYADALSDASGPAATYISMMRYNVALMVKGMW